MNLSFICQPCRTDEHGNCTGSGQCNCQHRTDRKNTHDGTGRVSN